MADGTNALGTDIPGNSTGDFDFGLDYGEWEHPARELQQAGRDALGDFGKMVADKLRAVERSVRRGQLEAPRTDDDRDKLNHRLILKEVQALFDLAEREGRTIDQREFWRNWEAQGKKGGQENKVYYEDGFYTKANTREFHGCWSEYLDRLLVHNALFADVAYEIIGMTRAGADFKPAIVTRQTAIVADREPSTQEEIDALMTGLGGEPDYADFHKFHFGSMILSDARPQNVIRDKHGHLYPFDLILVMNRNR
jgi:hypothetical protein